MEPEMQKEEFQETGRWRTEPQPARYIRQINPGSGAVAQWHARYHNDASSG